MFENIAMEQCQDIQLCEEIDYVYKDYVGLVDYSDIGTDYVQYVLFDNSITEVVKTQASYGWHSLVAEIGGTVSLFLGFDCLKVIVSFLNLLQTRRKVLKMILEKSLTLLLLIPFLIYAYLAMTTYFDEPVITMLETVTNTRTDKATIDFPLLTFCPKRKNTVRPSDSHFYDLLEYKIESQPNTSITQLILDHDQYQQHFDMFLRYDIKELITGPFIVDLNGNFNSLTDDRIWSLVYHRVYGPCYTLDINKQHNLNIVKGKLLPFGMCIFIYYRV
jgi:hypothetical protein